MGISRQNRVEVKSMLTAISSKPSRSGQVHTFTALDNAMSPHTVHVIFYYPRSPFGSFDLDSVRIPLSELLSMYPPAIGRVTKNPEGILEVKCNDAGLRILKAKVSVGIDEWLRSADGHEESNLTAWEDMPEDPSTWSPFRLQINEFEGGGVAIGLSCPHMHADATTLTVLLKSWTEAQRRQCITHPPSFSPLPYNLTDTDAVKSDRDSFSKPIAGPVSTKTATATFRFSGSAFTRCVKEHSIHEISPKATPFDVFAALFWTRVALVKDNSDRVCVCVDFRRLLPNPLPYGFFGNALNFSSLEMANVVNMEVRHVASLINKHVAGLNVEKIRSGLKRAGSQRKIYGTDLTIVNMEHMIVDGEPLMYETVFEEGVKPMHVSYRIGNNGGEGVITVIPSPEKGFGRTVAVTLPEAEEVFNDKEIENCFERRIWVSVSQTFTEEQIMRSILRNLGDASVGDDLGTLLRKIQQYLMGKRYLIVMDDVWDKNLSWWDKIHQGLPRGQGGSVIVTTRSESVAVKVQAREKTHRPELLSADNSWLLFCKVAFAANNGVCERSELEDVGKEIVTKCKGLPLTIKAVGGLLLCKDHVYHEWKRISEYFQDELRGNTSETDNVMSSLQLSYDELPSHLKSCFLTLSLYPEDCVIPKQQLVHGWIGEGFVMLRNGRSATESEEDCFSGLTNRCLVEVVDKTYSGTIVTCKIHDMVRDLVIDIAKNDSFSNSEGLNCRHIGVSGNFEEKQVRVNHRLRGLVSTTKTGEVNKLNSELAKKFTDCKYLRVLDISKSIFDAPLSDILDEIASLKHLACLSMSNTHPLIQLPRSMEDLQNLQILDASYCQNLKQLQPCIVLFKKLLVLDMTNCGSLEYFPKGIGSLGNLEVLLGFKPSMSSNGCKLSEVRNLTNLRKLGLSLTRGDQIEEDELDSLVNLSKLMLLSINCYDSYGDDLITKIDALTPPHQLHELSLEFYPGKLSPSWLSPKRLPMLRYMSICSGNLAKMHQRFWETETNTHWRIEALMFHSLSELEMDWEELQLSMPYLRTVHANWCPELETFPIEDVGFRGGVWTKTPTHRT